MCLKSILISEISSGIIESITEEEVSIRFETSDGPLNQTYPRSRINPKSELKVGAPVNSVCKLVLSESTAFPDSLTDDDWDCLEEHYLKRKNGQQMDKEEAIVFLKEHSKWLSDNWSMSPEGREYREKFDAAIEALSKKDAS